MDDPNQGMRTQESMHLAIRIHNQYIMSTTKMYYILYYSNNFAIEKGYLNLKDMYSHDLEALEQKNKVLNSSQYIKAYTIRKTGDNYDRMEKEIIRLQDAINKCSYGMWGKWYFDVAGWHRGIDNLQPDSSCKIHCIYPGEVIEVDYFVSTLCLINSEQFTITYMHLLKDANIVVGLKISAGQILGTESNQGPGDLPVHTHIEINRGLAKKNVFKRPWSSDRNSFRDNSIDDIISGDSVNISDTTKFILSCNPYEFFDLIFDSYPLIDPDILNPTL